MAVDFADPLFRLGRTVKTAGVPGGSQLETGEFFLAKMVAEGGSRRPRHSRQLRNQLASLDLKGSRWRLAIYPAGSGTEFFWFPGTPEL